MPAQKHFILPRKRGILLLLLNFIIVSSISIFISIKVQEEITYQAWTSFSTETKDVQAALAERLHIYEALLYSGKGLIDSNNATITPEKWHTYVSSLQLSKNYPAVATFGYGFLVKQADKANFVAQMRQELGNNFTITPPGNRPLYAVGTYLEPANPAGEGVDALVDPVRAKSIQDAIATGNITVSNKTTLYIDKVKVPAFVMRTVFYRQKAAVGYITATFRMQDLIQVALQHNFQGIRFAVYEGTSTKNLTTARLFYTNLPSTWQTSGKLSQIVTIPVVSHGWTMVFTDTTTPSLRDVYAPTVILWLGAIFAFLSTFLLYILLVRNRYVESVAEIMTKELSVTVEKLHDDKKKLEEAMTKDEFLSMAAHELRTPLGTMRWRIEDMVSGKRKFTPQTKEDLDKMYSNVIRLIHIVNNLLDVSRINQDKIKDHPDMIDVVTLAETVIDTLGERIEEKRVQVEFAKPTAAIPMKIDQNLLEEIFVNLFTNAIKYNKKGGKIFLRLAATQKELQITVEDTGIGIPKKDQKTIFEKFKRGSNVDPDSYEGTGLGLFVVKKYVEHWKGNITLKSVVNKGTTITVAIPMQRDIK